MVALDTFCDTRLISMAFSNIAEPNRDMDASTSTKASRFGLNSCSGGATAMLGSIH